MPVAVDEYDPYVPMCWAALLLPGPHGPVVRYALVSGWGSRGSPSEPYSNLTTAAFFLTPHILGHQAMEGE